MILGLGSGLNKKKRLLEKRQSKDSSGTLKTLHINSLIAKTLNESQR